MKNIILYTGAVVFSICMLFFVIAATWIGFDVKSACKAAKEKYEGSLPDEKMDCVEALVAVVGDESNGFRERNVAVWSLGQLGDRRVLPVLESYYTGIIPQREPYDKGISQYELRKAIDLARGGFNMTAFIWRNTVLK